MTNELTNEAHVLCAAHHALDHACPTCVDEGGAHLLERHELGRRCRTDTGAAVTHRLVRDGELGKVHAHHVSLDLDRGEELAVVHTNDRADHLGHDQHVAQVCLHRVRLVVRAAVLLGLAQLLTDRRTGRT